MEQFCRMLKPLANIYIIFSSWVLATLCLCLYFKPLIEYSRSAGLNTIPVVLDAMNYYTPDEGYQALSALGENGRNAYRLANYADFVLPLLFFLSFSLPNLAFGKECQYIIGPLIYMISEYIENIAEKYVLEIYPKRNDFVMTLACYSGLVKIIFFGISFLILIINGLQWILELNNQSKSMNQKQKVK